MTMSPARPRRERDPEVRWRQARRVLSLVNQAPKGVDQGFERAEPAKAPQTKIARRFWAQVFVGGITAIMYVLTPFRPDWIEAISGFDPDQHSGLAEWVATVGLLVVTLAMLGAFPWIRHPPSVRG
jgi:hypothetical protein